MQKYKHFDPSEFTCRCGCGRNGINPDFVSLLDFTREILGSPIVISSGYRCPEYDKAVGGKGNHPTGLAADLAIPDNEYRFWLVKALLAAGFRRIGIGERFIHVDATRGRPSPRIWTY